jgi:hypothetical protein
MLHQALRDMAQTGILSAGQPLQYGIGDRILIKVAHRKFPLSFPVRSGGPQKIY